MPKKHQGDTADARIREKIEAVFSKKTVCGTDNPLFELAKCTSANAALQITTTKVGLRMRKRKSGLMLSILMTYTMLVLIPLSSVRQPKVIRGRERSKQRQKS
jgi:hypothetical protein